jgi:type VI secretion system secreted protein VgrG
MKRRMICCLLVLLLAFGCAPAAPTAEVTPIATEAPAPTETPTPTLTPEPTPEPIGTAPIDLLSAPYDVFSGVVFPEGYTVYGARFDSADPPKSAYARYALYLTAEGNPAEIARYFAGVLGITDETKIQEYADTMETEIAQDIYGTYLGVPAFAMLKKTEAGYDYPECNEVNGCRVELAVDIPADQTGIYNALILQNSNDAIFGELSNQIGEVTILKDLMSIYVNVQRPERTTVYLLHKVESAEALMAEMAATLSPEWVDEQNKSLGLRYGYIKGNFNFQFEHNIVYEDLQLNENGTPARDFVKSDQSLMGLGFQLDPETGLYLYDDKSTEVRVEIAKAGASILENYRMAYVCVTNGYVLVLWYNEQAQTLTIQTDKDEISAKCDYQIASDTFGNAWPSDEMVQEHFALALGSPDGDVRAAAVQKMADDIQNRFGMTWQELYALPIW